MDTKRVIRVKRADRESRKHDRTAQDIRTEGFVKSLETLRPIYINQNRGLSL